MKKVLAILIVLNMAFALFACAGKPAESPSPSTPDETAGGATTEAPASEAPRSALELGFYDPSVDYASAERYKIAYIYAGTSVVFDMLNAAFAAWAEKMNVEYGSFSASNDEQFLSTVRSYCTQGYDGLVLDPDPAIFPAVAELVNSNSIAWMSGMTPACDENMKLLHPSVAYDDDALGFNMYQWCIDYAKATWPDATQENTGGMFIGYSGIGMPELRKNGAHDAWLKNGYSEETFFFLDGAAGDMTAQTAYNLAAPVLNDNQKIKYWIGCGFFDDYSIGIARAAADAGKAETTVCSTAGGTALISQWEAGGASSLKSAVCIEPRLYSEPIFCGLYAMITGKATAETLWPNWIGTGSGGTYASLLLPAVLLTQDVYKDYLAFVDQYTEIDQYPYPDTDKTFPILNEPPVSAAASTETAAASPSTTG